MLIKKQKNNLRNLKIIFHQKKSSDIIRAIMKKEIHPEYREVLFHDTSVDEYFLIPSTLNTDQTKEWEDGKTYPYCPLDVSSASHPFYTGKQKIIDSGGRVDRFKKRFAKKKAASPKVEEVELKSESTNEDNLKEDSESSNAEDS